MKLNQLKAGAVLTYISLGLGYIISIAYTPIMLRLLGQSEFGLYNLVASVVSYLGLLNFGFGSAYVRYYTLYKVKDDNENISKLNGMFLIIFLIIGLIATLAGAVLVHNSNKIFGNQLTSEELSIATSLMRIMIFNIAFSFPNIVFSSYITANEQFVILKLLELVRTVVNPLLILPILLVGYGSIGMVAVTTLLNILIQIINILFCFKKLDMKFKFSNFDFLLMKEMTVFSSYLFLNMIIDQINWNVDKFILGRLHGTVAVALYGLAAQINTYYLSISIAISNVFIPRVNKMVAKNASNEELTSLFVRVGRMQFIILSLILSGLIFFGKPFISMWVGSEYSEAYFIMLVLTIPVTIPLLQNIGIEIQKAKNAHKIRSLIYLLIAIINIIISIPLAREYKGVGAALGTAISLIIGNVCIMNWYYHNRIGLNMRVFWKQIIKFIPSLIIPFIVGIVMSLFIDLYNIKLFLVCGIVYVVSFSICIWVFGMNQYEKNLVGKPIVAVFRKLNILNK